MPYVDKYYVEDDERPDFEDTLEDQDGNIIDLTNANEVRFHVRHQPTDTLVVNAVATIDDATNGEVSYEFSDGELDAIGRHTAQWEIIWSDGDEQTIPQNRKLGLEVEESVEGDGTVGSVAAATSVVTKSSDYIADGNEVVLVDASGGPVTVTLPVPNSADLVHVKKTDSSSNAVTVATPGSQTIDGESAPTIDAQYGALEITSDGSNYFTTGSCGYGL